MAPLNIITSNVRGLRDQEKRRAFFAFLRGLDFNLKDTFRSYAPADPGFTWSNLRRSRSRIDYR